MQAFNPAFRRLQHFFCEFAARASTMQTQRGQLGTTLPSCVGQRSLREAAGCR